MGVKPGQTGTGQRPSHAEAAKRAIERRRQFVDGAIEDAVPTDGSADLPDASRHLIEAGGKRLRPAVLLLAAESLVGATPDELDYRAVPATDGASVDVLRAAASIEILHSFTLIHDDIMDDDDLRRGVAAVHREYDLSTAILAGDALYSKAFELLLGVGASPERTVRASSELARTCSRLCEGQSLDLAFETGVADPAEYLEMVEQKTGRLYAAAVATPAILLGYDDAVEPLLQYGLDVGRAFQIKDDLLDLTTPSEKLGKQRGSDLVEGKHTLVTAHARQQGVDVDALIDADSETVDEAAVEDAVAELEAAGSIDYAHRTARELIASGKARLDVLPDNESRKRLEDIADYLLAREY